MPAKGIAVTLDRGLLDRADKLLPHFRENSPAVLKYARLTRTSIVNIALERGLQLLEEEIALMSSEDVPPISPSEWRKVGVTDESSKTE